MRLPGDKEQGRDERPLLTGVDELHIQVEARIGAPARRIYQIIEQETRSKFP